MRIAFLNQPLSAFNVPPNSSVAIWQWEVAKRLVPEHEVLIVGRRDKRQPAIEQVAGVHLRRVTLARDWQGVRRMARWAEKKINAQKAAHTLSYYYLDYVLQAAWAARQWGAEIIQVQNFAQFLPIVRFFNPRAKILLHMHSDWLAQLPRAPLAHWLKPADVVIGCCDYLTQSAKTRFPEYADRCLTVLNGVDVEALAAPKVPAAGTHLLFVGRVSPEKGLHTLLEAFRAVAAQFPQAKLEIVGATKQLPLDYLLSLSADPAVQGLQEFYNGSDLHYFHYLQEQVAEWGLSERVTFTGAVPYDQIAQSYRHADIYLQPSYSEAFPLPVPEAMAAGLPVIASHVGGIPEAVEENRTGLLVPVGQVEALTQALTRLLEDEALRRTMGEAARQRAQTRFAWEAIARNSAKIYAHLCAA